MRRIIPVIMVAVLAASCGSMKKVPETGIKVLPMGDAVRLHEGAVVYALPLTAFEFTVVAEKRTMKAGPYYRYAEQLLGLKDVIAEDNVVWTIKEVIINPVLEGDPAQYYMIESDGLIEINALALRSAGLIMDISSDRYGHGIITGSNENNDAGLSFRDMGSDTYYNMEKDTTYKVVEFDTTFVRIPYVLEKRRQITLEQQAENTASILLELREGRHMILTGEANVFPQDRAAVDEINRLEDEYISLFTGKSAREKKTFRFFMIPTTEMVGQPTVLFRFSSGAGVVDASDLSGRPIVVEMVKSGNVQNINMIQKDLSVGQKYDKLYYRIPEIVNLRVTDGRNTLGSTRQPVYQYGKIVALPANYIIR